MADVGTHRLGTRAVPLPRYRSVRRSVVGAGPLGLSPRRYVLPHRRYAFGRLVQPLGIRNPDYAVPELVIHGRLGHIPVVVARRHIARGGELPPMRIAQIDIRSALLQASTGP